MAKVVKKKNLLARNENGEVRKAKGRKTVSVGTQRGPGSGMSIVAVDPGKTTGVAVWDAWDQCWYVDQIDAGRGRTVRYRVQGGIRESPAKVDAANRLDVKLATGFNVVRGGKRKTELAMADIMESACCQILADIVMACGPRTLFIMEDFMLGVGRGESVPAAALNLDGLSPMRINVRMHELGTHVGLWNGDAWRKFTMGWWTGEDGRGVRVKTHDPSTGRPLRDKGVIRLPSFRQRLTQVELWRLDPERVDEDGGVWGGGGVMRELQLPQHRVWLPGAGGKSGEQRVAQWMRDEGYWIPSRPHGMDALMHGFVGARKLSQIGVENQKKPEMIWASTEKRLRGVTEKVG